MTSIGIMASGVRLMTLAGTDVLMEPFNNLTAWTAVGGATIVAGRTGNGAQVTNSGTTLSYNIPSGPQSDTITVGFAIKNSHLGPHDILYLRSDAGATEHDKVTIDAAGKLIFARTSTTLATSAATIFATGAFRYVEVQVKLHDTAGTAIVRVDGTEVINITGVDTKNAGTKTVYDQIQFAMFDGRVDVIDDLYITTGAGAAFKGSITIP